MTYGSPYYGGGLPPLYDDAVTDLKNVYGPDNIDKWSDLDNDENPVTMAARRDWAIAMSYELVKSRIKITAYDWDDVASNPLVRHAVVLKAGLLLYANRGVSDEQEKSNPMRTHEREYNSFFKMLMHGAISLGDCRGGRGFPAAVRQDAGDVSTRLVVHSE